MGGMSAENVEAARRGYDAVLRGDLEQIAPILHPNVRWHGGDPDFEGACHSRSDVLEFVRAARQRGAIGELVDVVDAGDQVVVLLRPRGQEEIVANLTTFRDGLVVEMVHYPDPADALAAAGVAPRTP
jgi:ketosteroid isomerase-like protein